MTTIETLFQKLRVERRPAFMPFITAGDPDLAFTEQILQTISTSGADLIEVGFPFSDLIADGPVIQASYTRALNRKLKLEDLWQTLARASRSMTAPMVGMVSYTLIYKMGIDAFIERSLQSGLHGVVVPDLPVEEADLIAEKCRARQFHLILLITPTTSPERAAKIVRACSGFVYVVSVVGITGARAQVADQVQGLVERLKTLTPLPLCVGFGVSRPEHVRSIGQFADGVIVGSALVKHLEQAESDRSAATQSIAQLVRQLRDATSIQ